MHDQFLMSVLMRSEKLPRKNMWLTSTGRWLMAVGSVPGVGGRSPTVNPVAKSTLRFSASSRFTVSGWPAAPGGGGSGLLVICPFARLPCPEPCQVDPSYISSVLIKSAMRPCSAALPRALFSQDIPQNMFLLTSNNPLLLCAVPSTLKSAPTLMFETSGTLSKSGCLDLSLPHT